MDTPTNRTIVMDSEALEEVFTALEIAETPLCTIGHEHAQGANCDGWSPHEISAFTRGYEAVRKARNESYP